MTSAYDDRYDDAETTAQSITRPSDAPDAPNAPDQNALHVVEGYAKPAGTPAAESVVWTRTRLTGHSRPVQDGTGPKPERTGGGPGRTPRRLGGLDGLRAVAVMAVVLFHLDFSLLPGGFLGVDVFFVISGFLITNLIATEILRTGRFRLGRFYLRRLRRLLPTVLALLAVVTAASTTAWRDQLPTLPGGVFSSLGYVTNWWLILSHKSYFVATGRPTMVQHLWSLAIEEQYYVVWSAAVVLITGAALLVRRDLDPVRRLRVVVAVALGLALVSTGLMAWFAIRANVPYVGSTSRVYFGSDTHSMGLFLGSAVGAWLALRHASHGDGGPPRTHTVWRRLSIALTDLVGAFALCIAVSQFVHIDEFTPRLYRGGFLAFDAVVVVAVLCATRRGSLFGRVLDVRPVRWLGQRSYSIYIWHWPVCVVTRPGLDVEGSTFWINTARLALILGLSTLSYRFIEVPLRAGTFGRGALSAWRQRVRTARRSWWVVAAVSSTVVAGLALAANPATSSAPLTFPVHHPVHHPAHRTPGASPPPRAHGSSSAPAPISSAAHTSPRPAGSGRSSTPAGGGPGATATPGRLSISAYGDSVLLGAQSLLRARTAHLDLDAVEGRQANDVLDDVENAARAHTLRPYVLIHVGDNGVIDPDQLRATLRLLSDRTRVVLMTLRVPRDWQDINNTTIRQAGASFPNVVVDDWADQSNDRRDWLYNDGIHLRPAGAIAYTQLVMRAFGTP